MRQSLWNALPKTRIATLATESVKTGEAHHLSYYQFCKAEFEGLGLNVHPLKNSGGNTEGS